MGLMPKLFLLLAVAFFGADASEVVPVYMWQTIPTKGLFPAVTHVSQDTFKEILLQKQAHQQSKRIIIFAEPSLSPEDFSAKTFYELSQLSDHTRVTYLPTVSSPMEVIQTFSSEILSVSVDDIINDPKLLEKKQLIIDLNDAKDDEDRVDMLRRHSKFIAEVYEKVSASSRDNVLAVYTGRHSSWIVPSEIVKHRQTRAAAAGPLTPKATAHYLVYIDGVFVKIDEDGTTKKEYTPSDVIENENNDGTGTLTFKTDGGDIVLKYRMDVYGNWIAGTVTMDAANYPTEIYSPHGFSYSCSSKLTLRELKESGKPTFLQFPTFQLQYYVDGTPTEHVFDDSYDCVGFTSPAIWAGLFVTVILAIIISLGISMIMDIKTMDRFDDPKGKTITVNASD